MRAAVLLALLLMPGLAFGQTPAEKRAMVDKLLGELKAAPNSEVAGPIEQRIEKLWIDGSTAAVTLLMHRGLREAASGASAEAIETFGAAIVLDPTLAEAYHQRGVARFQSGDKAAAVIDFQEALKLEPREFAVWRSLTDIAMGREDWKGAYAAWQKFMELNPKSPNGENRLRELKRKAVGEDT